MSFEISQANISALAVGSGVLACGGGGNPYYAELVARDVLSKTRPVRVLDVEEMEADSVAITSAGVGAPLVGLEKPPSLIALRSGFEAVQHSLRVRVGAFVAAEVGGMQSIFPVLLAALNGLPLLDGDGMGRAFPEMQMCTFAIYGTTPTLPLAISDDHGLLWRVPSLPIRSRQHGSGSRSHGNLMGLAMERLLRRYCAYKGGLIYITSTFDKESMVRTLVRGSIGLALQIGRAIESARAFRHDPVEAIARVAGARRFLHGKVVDIERRYIAGHDWGKLRIDGIEGDRGRCAEIDFKNEYLILRIDGKTVLTVPDLITVVETDTGLPVTTEVARPGLRVEALGLRSSSMLRSEAALRVVGPRAFGYDLDFVPLE